MDGIGLEMAFTKVVILVLLLISAGGWFFCYRYLNIKFFAWIFLSIMMNVLALAIFSRVYIVPVQVILVVVWPLFNVVLLLILFWKWMQKATHKKR